MYRFVFFFSFFFVRGVVVGCCCCLLLEVMERGVGEVGWALPPKGFSCLVSENQFVFSELSGLSRWVTTLAMLFKRLS